jgi:hypothetical protein
MLVMLLAVSLITVSCTSATSLINAIVASTEAVLPYITQLLPADQATVATYINGAATITDTLLSCGQTVAVCVTSAVNQFNMLVLPTLSAFASPTIRELLSVVSVAIAAFVAAEGSVVKPATSTQVAKSPNFKISDRNKTEFRSRIVVVKAKLAPYLSH